MKTTNNAWKRFGKAPALVAGGLLAGAVLAGTISANAADTPTPSATSSAQSGTEDTRPAQPADPSQPQRADEQLLTGDVKTEVEAAVLASYPDATIERTETDSGGIYESHIVTADGERLTVLVGEDFAVTGTDDHGPRGA